MPTFDGLGVLIQKDKPIISLSRFGDPVQDVTWSDNVQALLCSPEGDNYLYVEIDLHRMHPDHIEALWACARANDVPTLRRIILATPGLTAGCFDTYAPPTDWDLSDAPQPTIH